MRTMLCAAALAGMVTAVGALPLKTQFVRYQVGDRVMVGYLTYRQNMVGRHTGVLVAPEWYGLNAYARRRADQLAELGYVALAADMYGDGQTSRNDQEAAAWSTALKNNRPEMRRRANAALDTLRKFGLVDPAQLAAIGYCFGGTTVLELARSGADVKAVVCFHGGLDSPHPEDARNIRGSLLICHGANDPLSPLKDVLAFQDELRAAGVDWQMIGYGNAVHAFTNPDAGSDPSRGTAYDARADRRSWNLMLSFFQDTFGPPEPPSPPTVIRP